MRFSPCSNTSPILSQDGVQAPFPVIDLEDLRRIFGPAHRQRPKKRGRKSETERPHAFVLDKVKVATRREPKKRTSGPQLPTAK